MNGVAPELSPSDPERAKRGNLALRVATAVVLAPLTVGIAYAGGWPWLCLVTAAAALLYFEWLMIVGASRHAASVALGIAVLVAAALLMMTGRAPWALGITAIGLVALLVMSGERRLWVAGGLCYAAAAMLASLVVRFDAAAGFLALIFVLLVVWVTDIGGYFAGRGIGGPRLWPRISPKKTWAGAIGGLVLSLVVAVVFAALGFGRLLPMLLLGTGLSVVSQLGDLFESAVKRQFGVKDSSQIIPGHGGLLDRLDGFVAAIAVAALIGVARGGLDGVGRGFMIW